MIPLGLLLMTIEEALTDLGVQHLRTGHHHCREGWLQIKSCPFCGSENYHLGWNLQNNFAACWKCGGHSGWNTLEALGVPREKIRDFLRCVDTETEFKREIPKISLQEPKGRGPLLDSHARYLRSRGFDPEVIRMLWSVEGIGIAARLSWRLYIPIVQYGKRISWTTRAIGDRVPQRYISASLEEGENPKRVIYGADFCSHSIVIVEGPLDAWKIGPGAGALFGTAYTTAQVKHLFKIPRRFICFDSSPDAQRKAQELADQLSCFPGTTENLVIDAKDPGEASNKELNLIRRVAGLL